VALIVLVALSLVLVGPTLADKLGQTTGWGAPFEWTWLILQWPLVFALVASGLGAAVAGAILMTRWWNRRGDSGKRTEVTLPS
jgi:hypothetical protein